MKCAKCDVIIDKDNTPNRFQLEELTRHQKHGCEIPVPLCESCALETIRITGAEIRNTFQKNFVNDLRKIEIHTMENCSKPHSYVDMLSAIVMLQVRNQDGELSTCKLDEAQHNCLSLLREKAFVIGADAVTGTRIQFSEMAGSLVMCMYGTGIRYDVV